MKYYIIIPAHNEALFLAETLRSVVGQTLLPKQLVVVNDHSTDDTEKIIDRFISDHPFISKVNTSSSTAHMPGSKVIDAFNKGLAILDGDYDFLVKLDADIILPPSYFEKISKIFRNNPKVGLAGGFIYEKDKNGNWALNHPMGKDHVRGAFKAYTKNCFLAIGGLKNAMGWDTVDELLAQYNSFDIYTDNTLVIKHLRPLGDAYDPKARLLQGKAMYTMRYGIIISMIASIKMAVEHKRPKVLRDNLKGFFKAKKEKSAFLVNPEEGKFIRQLRWKNIRAKLFRPI
ncbi:MAG TPA: glycosyltransferase family 2 protein [Arenibacter sp.]|nr:glycosyltransferase family 2 protein [Arenibacter sp.]